MNVSFDTLTLAIKAVLRDIERHEALSDTSDEADAEYHGQYALDLQRALSELGTLYRQARQQHPGSPTLDRKGVQKRGQVHLCLESFLRGGETGETGGGK